MFPVAPVLCLRAWRFLKRRPRAVARFTVSSQSSTELTCLTCIVLTLQQNSFGNCTTGQKPWLRCFTVEAEPNVLQLVSTCAGHVKHIMHVTAHAQLPKEEEEAAIKSSPTNVFVWFWRRTLLRFLSINCFHFLLGPCFLLPAEWAGNGFSQRSQC